LALSLTIGGALVASALLPHSGDAATRHDDPGSAVAADELQSPPSSTTSTPDQAVTTTSLTSTTVSSTVPAEPPGDAPAERPGPQADVPDGPRAVNAPSQPLGPTLILVLEDSGPVPTAFASALAGDPTRSNPIDAADGYAAAPSCAHRCITSGVAYAHGDDVELVVETSIPVSFYISVVADLDDDLDYEMQLVDSTAFGYTSHSWTLEDAVPGQIYYVMVSATDANFHIDNAWGEFTLP
jgi:hypothetical protein